MDRETVKRKIEKLLALGKSANESEALSAVQAARKLMLKYHISMSEGEEADIGNRQDSSQVSIKELRFKNTPINQHHLMLAFILAGNFRCKYFYQCGTVPRIKFLGFEEDVCAALALLAYLVGFMEQGAVQYRAWPSREQSWRDGFCMGVRDAFETQNQENPGYELMLAIPAEVMEAYEKLNIKKGPGGKKRTRAFSDGSAFAQGENSGKQAVDRRSLSSEE